MTFDEDEEISFTVVDELPEDSQGSQESSQKGSIIRDDARVTANQTRASSSDDRKLATFGLVEYSDDHTSIVKANDTVTPINAESRAPSHGNSERTSKRKGEDDFEQQLLDTDANSPGDSTSLSRVGQSILKRIKLGSSVEKPEHAHAVGSLMKNDAEAKEEVVIASKSKYRITEIWDLKGSQSITGCIAV